LPPHSKKLAITLSSKLRTEGEKLLACVHCGLCLEACPTYVITGDENDGPRGRLYLMRAVAEGRLGHTSESFERHIDRCLGCRACESVCPAGVDYGQLLEASRAELYLDPQRRGVQYRLLRFVLAHVWMYPKRLRFVFLMLRIFRRSGLPVALRKSRLARLISPRLEFGLALLESSVGIRKPEAPTTTTTGKATRAAFLFKGCVGEGLFGRVNTATERVLRYEGFAVEAPSKQVCCGALHAHAGDLAGARRLARQNVSAFGPGATDPIVTNAGGCGAMLKGYSHLLSEDSEWQERAHRFSERVFDIGQLLSNPTAVGSSTPVGIVTYDASCHLLYGQHAADASLAMVAAIPDISFASLKGSERCCGGAGIYNLLEPELSGLVLKEKLECLRQTGAETVATGNPGCQMQIGAGAKLAGLPIKVCHPVELLDEWYQRSGRYGPNG